MNLIKCGAQSLASIIEAHLFPYVPLLLLALALLALALLYNSGHSGHSLDALVLTGCIMP